VSAALDHLVVAARTLDEGVAWCETTLGITPDPGGRHVSMGTHNRVFSLASPRYPRAYFEIIAIDGEAPPPGRRRWFDLDSPALQAALLDGPQLVHWVLRCDDIETRCAQLQAAGIDRGEVLAAERDTPQGPLRWRISVRSDGARLFDGALPTLIAWGDRHPTDTLPHSGVRLESFTVSGLPAAALQGCRAAGVDVADSGSPLSARLSTPRGPVVLQSPSLESSHVQS
jgi:hypothetical protein